MRRPNDGLAYLVGIALGLLVIVAFGFIGFRAANVQDDDFSYVWAGSRAVLDGRDPYLPADWLATGLTYGTQRGPDGFYVYPPFVALALTPLAALPLDVASVVWTGGGMVLAAVAMWRLLQRVAPAQPVVATLTALALLVSQPGVATFWSGQWSFLLVAALATAARGALDGGARSSAAGLVLLAKPHLYALAAVGLARAHLASGRRRLVVLLAGAAAALVMLPLLVLPGWLARWVADLGRTRIVGERQPTTLPTALHDLLGSAGVPIAVVVLLAALAFALTLDARDPRTLAVWTALSLSAAIYEWSYDHLALLVPLAIGCGALREIAPRRGTLVAAATLTAFILVPSALYVVATMREDESYHAFVPLAVLVFTAIVAVSNARESAPVRRAAA